MQYQTLLQSRGFTRVISADQFPLQSTIILSHIAESEAKPAIVTKPVRNFKNAVKLKRSHKANTWAAQSTAYVGSSWAGRYNAAQHA